MLTPVDPGSLLSEEGDQPLACQGKQNNVACPACKTVPEELKLDKVPFLNLLFM